MEISDLMKREAEFNRDKAKSDKYKRKADKIMTENIKKFQKAMERNKKKQEKEGTQTGKSSSADLISEKRRTVALKDFENGDAKNRKFSIMATLGKRMGTIKKKQLLEQVDMSEESGFNDGTVTISAGNKNVLFKGRALFHKRFNIS